MRNTFSKLQEHFPEDHVCISVDLANAIVLDDADAVSQIISKYFSTADTVGLLDEAIAVCEYGEQVHIFPPAFWALEFGARKSLVTILRATENPNARKNLDEPENSPTLLMRAVGKKDIKVVELLLDAGANPNDEMIVNEKVSANALSMAIEMGLGETADLLLNSGAIPTFQAAISAIRGENSISMLEKIVTK